MILRKLHEIFIHIKLTRKTTWKRNVFLTYIAWDFLGPFCEKEFLFERSINHKVWHIDNEHWKTYFCEQYFELHILGLLWCPNFY